MHIELHPEDEVGHTDDGDGLGDGLGGGLGDRLGGGLGDGDELVHGKHIEPERPDKVHRQLEGEQKFPEDTYDIPS